MAGSEHHSARRRRPRDDAIAFMPVQYRDYYQILGVSRTPIRGALKLLHKSVAAVPEVVERFVREASAAGRIGNAHIVETIDAGELDSGEPYIFMELLDHRLRSSYYRNSS